MTKELLAISIEYLILVGSVIVLASCIVVGLSMVRLQSVSSTAVNATGTATLGSPLTLPALEIVQAIAAVMAAVFAIAFGLSQFIVPSIADKYSPRMLVLFKREPRYVLAHLLVFFSMFLSVASLLFIESLEGLLRFWMVVALMILFLSGLVAFSFYYSYIYQVADPSRFCSTMKDQVLSSLHDAEFVRNGSAALADSAIKALNRGGENENAKAFLDSLAIIAQELTKKSRENGDDQSIWESINSVLQDIRRINDAAQAKKETSITNELFFKMREIGVDLHAK